MSNMIYNSIYFEDEVRNCDNITDQSLSQFGIAIDRYQTAEILVSGGFTIVNPKFGNTIKTICRNFRGRQMVRVFAIFMYENGVTLLPTEFRDFEFEIFRILIGNGIIAGAVTPAVMIKAYKAIKKNGLRALLAAVLDGRSKNIRAWKCLTCKRFRASNSGIWTCKNRVHMIPDHLTYAEIANYYPDVISHGGYMYSSMLLTSPKTCGEVKPRVKTRLTKSVIYELDDQISIIRKMMNIDIK
jgi:hypothetical protein